MFQLVVVRPMYIHTYIYVCVCVRVRMYVYIYIHTYTRHCQRFRIRRHLGIVGPGTWNSRKLLSNASAVAALELAVADARRRIATKRIGSEVVNGAAFTTYCFTLKLYCGSPSSFYCPPHLQSLPYCYTIARPLRNKRLLPDPPLTSHTPCDVDIV